MATTLTNFQARLDARLWGANNPISRDVTVYNIASSSTDEHGEQYMTMDSGTSVKAIPYNKFTYQRDHLPWGELQVGETDMVFRYDTSMASGSIVVDSNDVVASYEVQDIEIFPYGNGSVATVARLKEQL